MPYMDPVKQTAYQKAWRMKRRQAWFAANGPCECGSWDDLELHHVDPGAKVSHRVWSWGAARRKAELAKCKALCASCHQAKTSEYLRAMRLKPIVHGTLAAYQRKDCRCEICCSSYSELRSRHRKASA